MATSVAEVSIADLAARMNRKYGEHEPTIPVGNPWLDRWCVYFKEKYGPENRDRVAKVIAGFWEDCDIAEVAIPGSCRLGGFVYGHGRHPNGAELFTSNIQRLVRVEQGRKGGIPHDLCYAETASGSKYYFFTDGHDSSMFLFLGDVIHFGGLEKQQEYYVPPRHRGKGYL